MPVSLEFLRGLVGGLSIFFAHFLGRSIARVSKGREGKRPLYTWAFRYALAVAAVCYHGVDRLAIIVFVLGVLLLVIGWWDERRSKREEDLTRTMFPPDQ
jgi:Flp pilus assembly protein TadB